MLHLPRFSAVDAVMMGKECDLAVSAFDGLHIRQAYAVAVQVVVDEILVGVGVDVRVVDFRNPPSID